MTEAARNGTLLGVWKANRETCRRKALELLEKPTAWADDPALRLPDGFLFRGGFPNGLYST